MTVVTTILLFFLIIVFDVHCGPTPTNDDTLLDKSLKTFKKDFNKLTENAEEFIEDFVHQVEEAGKLVGAGNIQSITEFIFITRKTYLVYQSDDEFNWHDATTTKPPYHLVSSIALAYNTFLLSGFMVEYGNNDTPYNHHLCPIRLQ